MKMKCISLIIVLCVLVESQARSPDHTGSRYTAGVVTLQCKDPPGAPQNILHELVINNTIKYVKHIENAGKLKVDMLVFPEATLNYCGMHNRNDARKFALIIPSVNDKITGCNYERYKKDSPLSAEILQTLCVAVNKAKTYAVFNVVEKVDCKKFEGTCGGKDPINLFNTNIVMDRSGSIIARYRKINLFDEQLMDTPRRHEVESFTTDFNQKFVTIICFDLLFKEPTIDAIKAGATNVLLSTMWFSKAPFLIAPQAQMGFAVASKVNLLAACAKLSEAGASGSGIYTPVEGALKIDFSESSEDQMLIANIPKIFPQTNTRRHTLPNLPSPCTAAGRPNRRNSVAGLSAPVLQNERTRLNIKQHAFPRINVEFTPIKEKHEVCPMKDHTLSTDHTVKECCRFDLKFTKYNLPKNLPEKESGYHYYFATYYGKRKMGGREMGELFCAVVACTGTADPKKECGQRKTNSRIHKTVNFESITITMTTESKKKNGDIFSNLLIMPSTLNLNMLPLEKNQYQFSSEILDKMKKSVISTCNNDELYTFGFYGRNFMADQPLKV